MSTHAAIRVSWFAWWFPRTAAFGRRLRFRFQAWNDARYERKEREVWGADYTIGDFSWDDDERELRAVRLVPVNEDEDTWDARLDAIPDDGWRPVSGLPLHDLSTWQPSAWTHSLPGPVKDPESRRRGGVITGVSVPADRAGEFHVAVPAIETRVQTAATVPPLPRLAAGTRPEAATPTPPPPATRYAPTAEEIAATLSVSVIKALGGQDANSWDTVWRRHDENIARNLAALETNHA